jgi:MFS family permease
VVVVEADSMSAPSTIAYLYAARAARGFGDGFAAIILPAYLIEIGFDPFQIGLVATAALLGSAALTLAIGFVGPRYDLRTLLIACAALMVLTGIAIPSGQHLLFIAAVAFIGTMNPTTGDIGVHVPLEQAALAQRASDRERTHIFARYSLIGALSIAAGALAAAAPDLLVSLGIDRLAALQAMFYLYAGLGLVGAAFYARLPYSKSEGTAPQTTALGPSRWTVCKLAALFSLDSFAGGFTVQSLLALWLFERFELSLALQAHSSSGRTC